MEAILGADDLQAEMAERYGWINRALPDADLDAFELTMPGADAIRADARRFHQLVISDAAQARTAALFMQGLAFLQLMLATDPTRLLALLYDLASASTSEPVLNPGRHTCEGRMARPAPGSTGCRVGGAAQLVHDLRGSMTRRARSGPGLGSLRGVGRCEGPARGDAQFGEHLAEVPFDGTGAGKEFRCSSVSLRPSAVDQCPDQYPHWLDKSGESRF
jgi:hypothetical protein